MGDLESSLPNLTADDKVSFDEKRDIDVVHDKHYGSFAKDDNVAYVNGEPVVSDGKDVSRFVVDLRDDGDPPVTFRSIILGTVFGGPGAAL